MTRTDAATAPSTTPAALPRTAVARWGAWLLTLSPAYFALVVASAVASFAASGVGSFDTITRAQMDALGVGWALENTLYALALILGTLGTVLLAWSLTRRGGPHVAWSWAAAALGAVAIGLLIPYAPLRIAAAGFTEPTLGQNPLYGVWEVPYAVSWYLVLGALVLLCAAQFLGTRHRASSVVLGVLALGVILCFAVQVELPPFVVALLWCPLGIVWVRAQRRAARATVGTSGLGTTAGAP